MNVSMMPSGVEHKIGFGPIGYALHPVNVSMMPSGVEHFYSPFRTHPPAVCECFYDAVRR